MCKGGLCWSRWTLRNFRGGPLGLAEGKKVKSDTKKHFYTTTGRTHVLPLSKQNPSHLGASCSMLEHTFRKGMFHTWMGKNEKKNAKAWGRFQHQVSNPCLVHCRAPPWPAVLRSHPRVVSPSNEYIISLCFKIRKRRERHSHP